MREEKKPVRDQDDEDEFFTVGLYNLDRQWVKLPRTYRKYSDLLAEAKKECEQAQAAFKLIEAELNLDVRKHPEDYDLPKTTNDAVKFLVIALPKYQKAEQKVIDAQHQVESLQAGLKTLEVCKKSLENLTTLYLHAYYAEPRAPKGKHDEVVDMRRRQHYDKHRYSNDRTEEG